MNWSSFADFVAMGGYGLYVWGSFGMCALVLGGEVAVAARAPQRAARLPFDAGDDPSPGVRR